MSSNKNGGKKMDLGIQGRTAFVAASSKGIGRACALGLAREGCRVVCCSRHIDEVQATAEDIQRQTGGEVLAFEADLNSREDIETLMNKTRAIFGKIEILVNNCGGPAPGPFKTTTEDQWKSGFESTLMSSVRLIRCVLPDMQAAGWGRIINITSVSVKQPIDGLLLSNAFRAGVIGMAKTLANEVGKDHITVNTVAPGYTLTQRLESLFDARSRELNVDREMLLEQVRKTIPLNRFGKPEEVANAVVFLASEAAAYISGSILPVDGGFIKGL